MEGNAKKDAGSPPKGKKRQNKGGTTDNPTAYDIVKRETSAGTRRRAASHGRTKISAT